MMGMDVRGQWDTNIKYMSEGSMWFKRLCKELRRMSPHFRIVRIKMGFYRIYWKQAYIHEVYKDMPQKGYDIFEEDPRIENKFYYEEFEDEVDTIRKIKNFVEGYYDSMDKIKTRLYMLKNDKEFREQAMKAYQTVVIK